MRRAALLIVAALWVLASGSLAGQGICPCPLTVSWDLDPSYDSAGTEWELEIDGVAANPCGNVVVLKAGRRCSGFIMPGRHTIRLRAVVNGSPGGWSQPVTQTFTLTGLLTSNPLFANLPTTGIIEAGRLDGAFNGSGTHHVRLAVAGNLLLVGAETNVRGVTQATWDGVPMTRLTSVDEAGGSGYVGRSEVWGLLAPHPGTHDLVLTWTGGGNANVAAVSYANVSQAALPSVSAIASLDAPGLLTPSISTIAANSWVFVFCASRRATDPVAAGETINSYDGVGTYAFVGDTGMIAARRRVTAGCSFGGGGNTVILVAFEPA